jgi:hypothetical protein
LAQAGKPSKSRAYLCQKSGSKLGFNFLLYKWFYLVNMDLCQVKTIKRVLPL